MPLNLFYTMVQKSQKWPKTQIKGGPALTASILSCQSCVVYTTFVGNSVLSFTTSELNYEKAFYRLIFVNLCC